MTRTDILRSLGVGVVLAALGDATRASVGLDVWHWHLARAANDVVIVFLARFTGDFFVWGMLLIVGPLLFTLVVFRPERDVGLHQTERQRDLEAFRARHDHRLRSIPRIK